MEKILKTINDWADRYVEGLEGNGSQNPVITKHVKDAIVYTCRRLLKVEDPKEKTLPGDLISYDTIIKMISDMTEIPVEVIKGGRRKKEIMKAKNYAMYLGREYTSLTFLRLAQGVGLINHSTALAAWRNMKGYLENNQDVRFEINNLKVEILSVITLKQKAIHSS